MRQDRGGRGEAGPCLRGPRRPGTSRDHRPAQPWAGDGQRAGRAVRRSPCRRCRSTSPASSRPAWSPAPGRPRRRPVHLAPAALEELTAWIDGYRLIHEQQFRRLDAVLEQPPRRRSSHDQRTHHHRPRGPAVHRLHPRVRRPGDGGLRGAPRPRPVPAVDDRRRLRDGPRAPRVRQRRPLALRPPRRGRRRVRASTACSTPCARTSSRSRPSSSRACPTSCPSSR